MWTEAVETPVDVTSSDSHKIYDQDLYTLSYNTSFFIAELHICHVSWLRSWIFSSIICDVIHNVIQTFSDVINEVGGGRTFGIYNNEPQPASFIWHHRSREKIMLFQRKIVQKCLKKIFFVFAQFFLPWICLGKVRKSRFSQ